MSCSVEADPFSPVAGVGVEVGSVSSAMVVIEDASVSGLFALQLAETMAPVSKMNAHLRFLLLEPMQQLLTARSAILLAPTSAA